MQNQELPLYTESAKLKLVHVPLIPDGQPGSVDLAEKVLTAVSHTSEDTTAFLMEAHGVLILGETMENCFHQAELLEDSSQNCRLSETTPPLSAVHRSQAERVR